MSHMKHPKKTHAFLSHDRGIGSVNHILVRRINAELESNGLVTWFNDDDDPCGGHVLSRERSGINNAAVVICFITENYQKKVNSTNNFSR